MYTSKPSITAVAAEISTASTRRILASQNVLPAGAGSAVMNHPFSATATEARAISYLGETQLEARVTKVTRCPQRSTGRPV